MKHTILTAALLVVFTTGCETAKPTVQTEYVFKARPKTLSQKCPKVAPPNKVAYKAADWETKEDMLMHTIREQNKVIDKCNLQTDDGVKWDELQKANYAKHKEAP